jgi:hypothetical protein
LFWVKFPYLLLESKTTKFVEKNTHTLLLPLFVCCSMFLFFCSNLSACCRYLSNTPIAFLILFTPVVLPDQNTRCFLGLTACFLFLGSCDKQFLFLSRVHFSKLAKLPCWVFPKLVEAPGSHPYILAFVKVSPFFSRLSLSKTFFDHVASTSLTCFLFIRDSLLFVFFV